MARADTIPPRSVDPRFKAMLMRELGGLSQNTQAIWTAIEQIVERFDRESKRIDAMGYRADELEDAHRKLEASMRHELDAVRVELQGVAGAAGRIESKLDSNHAKVELALEGNRAQDSEIDRLKNGLKLVTYIVLAGGAVGGGAAGALKGIAALLGN